MSKTRQLTTTALLIAIAVLVQFTVFKSLGAQSPVSLYIVGSIVNLCLIVAIGNINIWSALFVSILTPVVAGLLGHSINPVQLPVVAIGNFLFPLVWYILHDKLKLVSQFLCVIIGALVKFAFLWWAMPFAMKLFTGNVPAIILRNFSWPQLFTALIGGCLAVIICRYLPKQPQNNKN